MVFLTSANIPDCSTPDIGDPPDFHAAVDHHIGTRDIGTLVDTRDSATLKAAMTRRISDLLSAMCPAPH